MKLLKQLPYLNVLYTGLKAGVNDTAMSGEIGTMKGTRQIDQWRPRSPDQSVGLRAF